ncbi:uncharacterized protein LOC112175563 isoform X3 [Rosa chinensis]|uniref:uncharacterized protein LOC112175563 isoform X3 n=1 Tax=Rosa chinensis TaxID=74649 RepID=UPI001AD90BEE|nr:uncharacterized protein LOC112175563 isoform X3 [Rosa chinensis]
MITITLCLTLRFLIRVKIHGQGFHMPLCFCGWTLEGWCFEETLGVNIHSSSNFPFFEFLVNGGESTLENCQVLQAKVNRSKGNRTEYSRAELIQKSSYCRVSGRDMDLIELSAYGNVRPAREDSYCPVPGRGVDLIDLSAKGNIRNAQEFWGCTIQ